MNYIFILILWRWNLTYVDNHRAALLFIGFFSLFLSLSPSYCSSVNHSTFFFVSKEGMIDFVEGNQCPFLLILIRPWDCRVVFLTVKDEARMLNLVAFEVEKLSWIEFDEENNNEFYEKDRNERVWVKERRILFRLQRLNVR